MTGTEVSRDEAERVARESDGYSSSVDVNALARTVVALYDQLAELWAAHEQSISPASHEAALAIRDEEGAALRSCVDRLRNGWTVSEAEPVWCLNGRDPEPMSDAERSVMEGP